MADTEPPTPPAQPTNFLSLPRELRDMVYTLALVQPPLWNRTHLPTCPLLDTDTPLAMARLLLHPINRPGHQIRRFLHARQLPQITQILHRQEPSND